MRRKFTRTYSFILTALLTMSISIGMSGPLQQKSDTTYLHLQKYSKKQSYLKPNFKVTLPNKTAVNVPAARTSTVADDKILNTNVQVYPNPVIDQINIKYVVSRSSNVNIKIMDVLGNEIINLSSRADVGENKFTYNLNNKLNSGFYFVRLVVGPESVIRRISIL